MRCLYGGLIEKIDSLFIIEESGCFPNRRSMDKLFFNRMNSQQGIIRKEQDMIYKISIG